MSMKMNTLLGITDHAQAVANKEISDYTAMFKSKGGQFVGELKMEPIPLKKPTTKCKRWELSEEMLKKFAESFE